MERFYSIVLQQYVYSKVLPLYHNIQLRSLKCNLIDNTTTLYCRAIMLHANMIVDCSPNSLVVGVKCLAFCGALRCRFVCFCCPGGDGLQFSVLLLVALWFAFADLRCSSGMLASSGAEASQRKHTLRRIPDQPSECMLQKVYSVFGRPSNKTP